MVNRRISIKRQGLAVAAALFLSGCMTDGVGLGMFGAGVQRGYAYGPAPYAYAPPPRPVRCLVVEIRPGFSTVNCQ